MSACDAHGVEPDPACLICATLARDLEVRLQVLGTLMDSVVAAIADAPNSCSDTDCISAVSELEAIMHLLRGRHVQLRRPPRQ